MSDAEQREEAVFEAALKLAADQRAAYLDQTCAGDDRLRRRVGGLLDAFEHAGGFLKEPAVSTPERTVVLRPTEKPGDKIGRYKLLEQIGEGGCGVVYVAEQEEPVRRRVALKVIKLGMDTKQVIARFDAERQALAMMDHPNIAKIHDAGITEVPASDPGSSGRESAHSSPAESQSRLTSAATLSPGRPYFVMELVRGVKITDYCDQHQLAPRERLDLFIQVCRAIQHAHQKGIIHRDIKPSNILVTLHDGVPVPKVIDFGIAKATQGRLTDQTVYTAFEQFIGTPAYMSPEQAELGGLDIDTRSDIYSLGVLLYELLTGKTPFDAKELLAAGLDEMRRTIREVEPTKPSTRLTQELNAQGGKGEREKRGSATAPPAKSPFPLFSSAPFPAIQRQLCVEKSLIEQLRGDLDWIVMKCLEKDRTRRYETANGLATDIARHLSNEPIIARPPSQLYRFQKSVQRNKLAFGAATAVAVAFVIGLAVSTAMFFRAQAEKKKAQTEAAKSQQVAQFLKDMLKGVGPSVALGRDTTMLREILDETAARIGNDLTNQPEVEVELCLTLAATYHDLGLYKEMEGVARHSLQVARTTLGQENEGVAASLSWLANALMHAAQMHLGEIHPANLEEAYRRLHDDNLVEAEKYCRESLAMSRKLLGDENLTVANALNLLANVLATQSRLAEAETMQREAVTMYIKLIGNEHPKVARLLYELAIFLALQDNKLTEAEAMNREALAMQRKLLGNDHPEIAKSLFNLAVVLKRQGKWAEAETRYREVVTMWRKLQANDRIEVADALNHLAEILRVQTKLLEAETRQREALVMQRRLFGNQHAEVADSISSLALILRQQGKLAEAETTYREALAMRRKLQTNAATEKKPEPH